MATQEMKIKIGADVSGGIAGVKQFNTSLGSIPASAQKAQSALQNIAPEGAINEARLTVKRLKDEISSLSAVQLKSPTGKFLTGELTSAKKELKDIETQAGLTADKVGNPLVKSFGLLRTAANVLPGIGIAGIIGAAAAAITELVTEITSGSSAIKEANNEIAKSFAESFGKASGETANLNALLSVARDETLSKTARTQAIKELNQEYDKFLPKLTLENINTEAVISATDRLTNSLIRQAKIKGVQDLISKETAKQAELFAGDIEDNATSLDKFLAVLKSPPGTSNLAIIQAGVERTGKEFAKSNDKIKAFNDALRELTKEEAVNGTLFQDKSKSTEDILSKRLALLEKIRDATKDITEKTNVSEQIAQVKFKINARDLGKGVITQQEAKLAIQNINDELNKAFQAEAISLEGIAKIKVTNVQRVEIPPIDTDKIAKATGLDKGIKVSTDFEIDVKLRGLEFAKEAERIKGLVAQFSESIKSSISDLFTGIGEGIGQLITGEGIGSIIKPFTSFLGDILIQLGKFTIAAGLKIKILKDTLTKFAIKNPLLAVAAGVGAIALGTILKNQFNQQKLPGFADGGIAKGPKSGFPVILHGEELIVPMNKVNRINTNSLQGVGGSIQLAPVSISIPGQQLKILLDRVGRSNDRFF